MLVVAVEPLDLGLVVRRGCEEVVFDGGFRKRSGREQGHDQLVLGRRERRRGAVVDMGRRNTSNSVVQPRVQPLKLFHSLNDRAEVSTRDRHDTT